MSGKPYKKTKLQNRQAELRRKVRLSKEPRRARNADKEAAIQALILNVSAIRRRFGSGIWTRKLPEAFSVYLAAAGMPDAPAEVLR